VGKAAKDLGLTTKRLPDGKRRGVVLSEEGLARLEFFLRDVFRCN